MSRRSGKFYNVNEVTNIAEQLLNEQRAYNRFEVAKSNEDMIRIEEGGDVWYNGLVDVIGWSWF